MSLFKKTLILITFIIPLLTACGGSGSGGSEPVDVTPNQFYFIDQNDVQKSTIIQSNLISVSGITSEVSISVIGGAYSINGGVFVSSNGVINNNDTVIVQHVSSVNDSTAVDTVLTIGGVTDTFTSITTVVITCNTVNVPDTGQTQSYTGITGEDSDYSINTQSFTSNGNGTVTDNITNMVWQNTITAGNYSWTAANQVCVNATTGGFMNWRLPNIHELIQIMDYGKTYPALDTSIFMGASTAPLIDLWASDEDINNSNNAWAVRYSLGFALTSDKASPPVTKDVLCVRGNTAQSSYANIGSVAVDDKSTGLVWQKDTSSVLAWESAIQYCESLDLGGRNDWRLPNIKELHSIVDVTAFSPSINGVYFPNTVESYYWSSTHQIHGATNAWPVYFQTGGILNWGQADGASVRCVVCGL